MDEDENENKTKTILGHAVESRDPQGFWHFIDPPSPELEGAYTSLFEIEKAITRLVQK